MSKILKKDIVVAIVNYIIICFVMLLVIFAVKFSRESATNRYVEDITEQWKNYYGKSIDLEKICEKNQLKKKKSTYAKYDLKRRVNRNYTLVFRASDCFVNVYVDGKLVSTDADKQNSIFGKSPGHRWHMVSINSDNKSCKITLEVNPVYYNGKGSINNVYIGSPLGVVKQVMWDRIVGFIISIVLVLLGAMLCCIYVFAKKKNIKDGSDIVVGRIIFQIGCLTGLMGIYSSLETYFWQFFIGKSHFFQLMSYIAVFLISIIIGVIVRELIKEKKRILGVILYWLGIILFAIATILNFSGILEYYYVMKIVYIYCGILSIIIFIEGYFYIKKQEFISKKLLFGVCFFSVTFSCDCLRYLSGVPDDICAYTRVGFLVFIICIMVDVCGKVIKTMQQGVLAQFYKKMADSDNLTGLYNRNALLFDECKYNEYIRNNQMLAVVMFDVNDLKYTNDTFGHEKGDILIKSTASIINDTFGKVGTCYRTGGDEFVSVIVGDNVNEIYDETLEKFLDKIKMYNKEIDKKDKLLEIAYGVYMSNEENMGVIWQKADELMYQKKKDMKSKHK